MISSLIDQLMNRMTLPAQLYLAGAVLVPWAYAYIKKVSLQDLIANKRFWIYQVVCLILASAGYFYAKRVIPFPEGQAGVLLCPLQNDAQGAHQALLTTLLAAKFPELKQRQLPQTKPPTVEELGKLAQTYRAELAIAGAGLSENRLALYLARPKGKTYIYTQAASDEAMLVKHIQAERATPAAEAWSALLLTVSDYPEPLPSRPQANDDGKALLQTLLELGLKREQLHHLEQVKAAALHQELARFERTLTSADRLLVFYQGNLITHQGRSYLCPSDIREPEYTKTAWDLELLIARLKAMKAEVFLILDAPVDKKLAPAGKLQILAAGQPGDGLFSSAELSFSSLLIDGLKGAADRDGDRVLRLNELLRHLHPLQEIMQNPWSSDVDRYFFHCPKGEP